MVAICFFMMSPFLKFALPLSLKRAGADLTATRSLYRCQRILPRTSAKRTMRFGGSLLASARSLHGCRFRSRHRGSHPPLFFRRELENIIGQQFAMVSSEAVEGRRRGPGEDPLVV